MIGTNIFSKERFGCLLCGANFLPSSTKEIVAGVQQPQTAAIAAYFKHRETCNARTRPAEAQKIIDAAFDEMEQHLPGYKRPEGSLKSIVSRRRECMEWYWVEGPIAFDMRISTTKTERLR